MHLSVYLNFAGNAEEVLQFYAQAFDGSVSELMRYDCRPELKAMLPADWLSKVMHGAMMAGDVQIMASDVILGRDGPCAMSELNFAASPVTLALHFTELTRQQQVFDRLAVGGKIEQALEDAFWGARFGMLVDKFGIKWIFNYDYPKS